MKFLKVGRVAIITRGRYAGKKVRFFYLPARPAIAFEPGGQFLPSAPIDGSMGAWEENWEGIWERRECTVIQGFSRIHWQH